jgi:hypothetical protein
MPSFKAGADLDLSRTDLALDVCAPGLNVVDVFESVDYLAVCQQLPVVVAAIGPRDQAVDGRRMSTGSCMTRPLMMMPHPRRDARVRP